MQSKSCQVIRAGHKMEATFFWQQHQGNISTEGRNHFEIRNELVKYRNPAQMQPVKWGIEMQG